MYSLHSDESETDSTNRNFEDEITHGQSNHYRDNLNKPQAIDFFIKSTINEQNSVDLIVKQLCLQRNGHPAEIEIEHEKFGEGIIYNNKEGDKIYVYQSFNSNEVEGIEKPTMNLFKSKHWKGEPIVISLSTPKEVNHYSSMIKQIVNLIHSEHIPSLVYKYQNGHIELYAMHTGIENSEKINIRTII
jgi:hypothetical protein